jgi:hypothetical protein
MALYKLTRNGGVVKTVPAPNAIDPPIITSIPPDPSNADYLAYQQWLADGNTPDPADPAPLVYQDDIELRARIRTTNATATELYRSTLRAMTGYAGELRVIGVDAGNGACRVVRASVLVKRLAAGAIMSTPVVVMANHAETGATTWVIAASVSGNDFVVTVTGANGRNIDWSLRGEVEAFTPAGV